MIGGSSVYAESLKSSQLNSLYITKIHQAIAILEIKAMLWLGILKGCGSAIHWLKNFKKYTWYNNNSTERVIMFILILEYIQYRPLYL